MPEGYVDSQPRFQPWKAIPTVLCCSFANEIAQFEEAHTDDAKQLDFGELLDSVSEAGVCGCEAILMHSCCVIVIQYHT